MAIINVRSPYYVSITDVGISYSTLDITIWNGDSDTIPAENDSYSLKKYTHTTETTISFEIAELIRDYLDLEFDGNYSTTGSSNDSCKWVKIIIKSYNSSDVLLDTITSTKLAINGYGYFEEGSSFDISNESLLASKSDIFLPKFGDSNIAIYTGNYPLVSLIDKDGNAVVDNVFPSSIDSSLQLEYVSLYPELITNLGFNDNSDWQLRPGDIIRDGQLYFNGAVGSRSPNTFTPISGTNYILNFTITEINSGFLDGVFDGSGGINLTGVINEVGDYSVQYTQSSVPSLNFVSFFSALGFNGAMDNVSVKEVYDVVKVKVTNGTTVKSYKERVLADTGTFENSNCLLTSLNLNELTRSLNVIQVKECKFKPHKVTFVNKNGTLEDMYFFKKSTDNLTTKRESYNSNTIKSDNSYSINQHTKSDFNITANSSVKLSSGFLNESVNEKFKQLLLSEKVWITRTFNNSELVLPINIKTSNISYKTSLNDRLVEYSFEFNDSYNTINNIR